MRSSRLSRRSRASRVLPGGGAGGGLASYSSLLASQGFTSYWALQNVRADLATEPDLLGSIPLTMNGGGTVNEPSGPLAASDGNAAQTFATNDTEGMTSVISGIGGDRTWTLSLWIKLTTQAAATSTIVGFDKAADTFTYIYLMRRADRSGLTIQIGDGAGGGGANFLDFGVEISNSGAWNHLVVTRAYSATATADIWSIYRNGSLISATSRNAIGHGIIGADLDRIGLGNRYSINNGMDGSLAHVAFAHNVAISAAAVAAQWAYRNF